MLKSGFISHSGVVYQGQKSMALIFSTTTIKHRYRHLKKPTAALTYIFFLNSVLRLDLIERLGSLDPINNEQKFCQLQPIFKRSMHNIKKMLLKVHFTSKLKKIVILRETHVCIFVGLSCVVSREGCSKNPVPSEKPHDRPTDLFFIPVWV